MSSERPTHCIRGHAFTPDNTYIKPNGAWSCRACHAARTRAHRAAHPRTKRAEALAAWTARRPATTEVERAWAAGLFEGEGTVTYSAVDDGAHTRLYVYVANTDFEVVAFFQERWPGAGIRRRVHTNPNYRDFYAWRISSMRAAAFLREIQPFLRTERVRAKVALALEAEAARRLGGFTSAEDVEQYRALFDSYRERLRAMNRRGRQAIHANVVLPNPEEE